MKRITVSIFMLFFAFAIASCSTGSPATGAKETPAQASSLVPFPEMAGVDQLTSYTVALRVSFKGTQDGQPLDTTEIYTRMVAQDPAAQFTTIQTTGEDGKLTTYLRGWVGDVLYMRGGSEAPCTARVISTADRQTFNPAALVNPIVQGNEVGLESVNGLSAHHYVINAAQGANAQISGEVWIAEPARYVVRYVMSLKGGEEYFGKGITGEKTISFEVSDAGANKPVALPEGCPPPLTNIPAMPDAAGLTRSLTQLSYTTTASMDDVAAFYKDQMKSLGWSLKSSSTASALTQPPSGLENIPNLSKLTLVPGMDLKKYLPTQNLPKAVPVSQAGWMIFAQGQETVYINLQPEGSTLRVQIQLNPQ